MLATANILVKGRKMKIHLLSNGSSVTASMICSALCADGHGASFGPRSTDGAFVINYGIVSRQADLNGGIVCDKREQLIMLKDAGIPAIEVIMDISGHTRMSDISVDFLPAMARKVQHTRGKDIVWLPSMDAVVNNWERVRTRDFIVGYVDKDREFRVHVLGGRWKSVSEKIYSDNGKNDKLREFVWSHRFGWVHVNLGLNDPILGAITRVAIDATKALHFDFGAVDVISLEDGSVRVLEVNSAPGLIERRAIMYKDFFVSCAGGS
jgi:hypothetical protein